MAIRLSRAEAKKFGVKPPSAPRRGMNKLETEYAAILSTLKAAGYVQDYRYEAIKLRIGGEGERCWYTPDFLVVRSTGAIEIHEVKGPFEREDARVKRLAAARIYPEFRFFLVRRISGVLHAEPIAP